MGVEREGKPTSWRDLFRAKLLKLNGEECALRPTDESVHHQERLARRLQVANLVHNSWTCSGRDPAAVAERLVDGSVKTLENFVTEVAEEESRSPRASSPCEEEEEEEEEGASTTSCSTLDVREASQLTYDEFWLEYLHPNRPVMICGVSKDWRATREWVDSDGEVNTKFLAETFGDASVWVHSKKGTGEREKWTLKEYLKYWVDQSQARRRKQDCDEENNDGDDDMPLLYLKDWHFPTEFAEYGAYTTPEYFVDDWLNEYYDSLQGKDFENAVDNQRALEQSDYRFVYLGPKGTRTGLHADVLRSFSWSVNLRGLKRWYLLSPKYTHLLYDTFGLNMAPSFFDVDEQSFPNLKHAKKHLIEVLQKEGEAIFVPSGWHHTVENLQDTLSINHNWFNVCNINYSWELLQRERHEAEQSICDCRATCADDNEFEALVQRNVAANASMNYENFADLLIMIAESRIKRCSGKREDDIEYLKQAYEVKVAYTILSNLLERFTNQEFKAKTKKVLKSIEGAFPSVNFELRKE